MIYFDASWWVRKSNGEMKQCLPWQCQLQDWQERIRSCSCCDPTCRSCQDCKWLSSWPARQCPEWDCQDQKPCNCKGSHLLQQRSGPESDQRNFWCPPSLKPNSHRSRLALQLSAKSIHVIVQTKLNITLSPWAGSWSSRMHDKSKLVHGCKELPPSLQEYYQWIQLPLWNCFHSQPKNQLSHRRAVINVVCDHKPWLLVAFLLGAPHCLLTSECHQCCYQIPMAYPYNLLSGPKMNMPVHKQSHWLFVIWKWLLPD